MLPFELTKDTPYLALPGELWSVFYEYFNRNWPCYKGFLLYHDVPLVLSVGAGHVKEAFDVNHTSMYQYFCRLFSLPIRSVDYISTSMVKITCWLIASSSCWHTSNIKCNAYMHTILTVSMNMSDLCMSNSPMQCLRFRMTLTVPGGSILTNTYIF